MSRLKDYTEFSFAAMRTIAAVFVVAFMITAPKPLAIIVPGPYPTMELPMNMTFMQETIPDYSDGEERVHVEEYRVQVTGGEYSRLQQRNLFEEVREHYFIITRNCNQSALMDFATVRIYVDTGYMEIEFDIMNTICTVVDTTYGKPSEDEIPFP